MYLDAELALAYKFANAPIMGFPYPHFYIRDVFPFDFYERLQANIPDPSLMIPIEEARGVKGYAERFVLEINTTKHQELLPADKREFWRDFSQWLCAGRFAGLALGRFKPFIQQRFGSGPLPELHDEALLVQDISKYSLGPHTDTPRKVITMLFYLPKDTSQSHLGTSIYVPKEPNYTCKGSLVYDFDAFARVHTMPFLPNSLFVFFKTDNSFHGVEPVADPDTKRWLLLYDIYARLPQQTEAPATSPQMPHVQFKI